MRDNLRAQLITIAAELVHGFHGLRIDEQQWCKSTPLMERRRILSAMDALEEDHKLLGLRIKVIADKLTCPLPAPPTEVKP